MLSLLDLTSLSIFTAGNSLHFSWSSFTEWTLWSSVTSKLVVSPQALKEWTITSNGTSFHNETTHLQSSRFEGALICPEEVQLSMSTPVAFYPFFVNFTVMCFEREVPCNISTRTVPVRISLIFFFTAAVLWQWKVSHTSNLREKTRAPQTWLSQDKVQGVGEREKSPTTGAK